MLTLFNLIYSFHLIGDLALGLIGHNLREGNDDNLKERQTIAPSASRLVFTKLLELLLGGSGNTARQLLDIPSGLRSRKLALWLHEKTFGG